MAQINKPTDYFNTKLYTGTGSSNSVTGVGFQPDFTWIKERSSTSSHNLYDGVRGVTKVLESNSTSAEQTSVNGLTSFDTNGFTVVSDGASNENGQTYASWNWLADNTSGSSNTDGTITSSVSANTTAGFSIVKYTGTGSGSDTVGHGLGVTPDFIIVKIYSVTQGWMCFHKSLGNNGYIQLNTTGASGTSSGFWGTPNSTTFGLSAGLSNNVSGEDTIAYCFAEKKGFSKFGSYTGNNNADGTFVYTGFKPAFVMMKSSSTGGDNAYSWSMFDNKRSSYNIERAMLKANLSDAEYTSGSNADVDLLSNGFKMRASPNETNGANTYIYMAFAESPLVGTNNIPATAR